MHIHASKKVPQALSHTRLPRSGPPAAGSIHLDIPLPLPEVFASRSFFLNEFGPKHLAAEKVVVRWSSKNSQ